MTSGLETEVAALVSTAAILFAIFVFSGRNIARSRRRVRELRLVSNMLELHRESLEGFMQRPEVPNDLKARVLIFSETISDRDTAQKVAEHLRSPDTRHGSARGKTLQKDLAQLRASEPEVADLFEAVVKSGLLVLVYRWGDTAELFESLLTKAVTVRGEAALFDRVVCSGTELRGTYKSAAA